ncbi:hypothetical protein OG976_22970 [Mycobacterium sp. NBC_00419]|uniref:hypothetical protein n=1 Tax=Mycobacterium sp. NBC_00419 TaxID=2975989 RepID=UPI002E1C6BDB
MSKVPSLRPSRDRNHLPAERLPLRWVVIALLASAAGGVGYLSAGIVTAIVTACTVAAALHRIIA